jgi:outer membrane protein, multidrug efflux system
VRGVATVLVAAGALASCAVGPDYQRPETALPAAWTTEAPWHAARPDDAIDRGQWWHIFKEPALDALESDAVERNPSLAIASEHLAQARAIVTIAASSLYPSVNLNAGENRLKISQDRPRASYTLPNASTVQNDLNSGFAVRYELDLFGAVRRQAESARASFDQARADLANARLVVTAELAADYFNLRGLDTEIDVVRRNIEAQRRALELVSARHDNGVASGLDLGEQQAQLDTTVTQIDLLRVQRAQFEHAIARLVGAPAPAFSIPPQSAPIEVPAVPVGIPSDVLQRRPDVASAERAMAAANAQVGAAKAAFFPTIMLGANYGRESNQLTNLLSAPSALWSLGVAATQPLFDAGRIGAGVDFAQAGYRSSVAAYRDAVLGAMQEVQDGMSSTTFLARAAAESDAAVKSSLHVVALATDRYTGGLATYLDVINAQQTLLTNQRQQAQIHGQQTVNAVFLVKALGGGWEGLEGTVLAQQH